MTKLWPCNILSTLKYWKQVFRFNSTLACLKICFVVVIKTKWIKKSVLKIICIEDEEDRPPSFFINMFETVGRILMELGYHDEVCTYIWIACNLFDYTSTFHSFFTVSWNIADMHRNYKNSQSINLNLFILVCSQRSFYTLCTKTVYYLFYFS